MVVKRFFDEDQSQENKGKKTGRGIGKSWEYTGFATRPLEEAIYTNAEKKAAKKEAVNHVRRDFWYKEIQGLKNSRGEPTGTVFRCMQHEACDHQCKVEWESEGRQWKVYECSNHSRKTKSVDGFLKEKKIPLKFKKEVSVRNGSV